MMVSKTSKSAHKDTMTFSFTPMTITAAQAIDQWHYPGMYGFYDLDQDAEDREAFLNPHNWEHRHYAVENAHHELVGFFSFYHESDTITLGLGLHPNYTGKGLGTAFVQAGLDFGDQVFHPTRYELSVATFNRRAIRVYEQCGFTAETIVLQRTNGGEYEFLHMSRPASVQDTSEDVSR